MYTVMRRVCVRLDKVSSVACMRVCTCIVLKMHVYMYVYIHACIR